MNKENERNNKDFDLSEVIRSSEKEVLSVEEEDTAIELELDVDAAEEVDSVIELELEADAAEAVEEITTEKLVENLEGLEINEEDAEEAEFELELESAEDAEPELTAETAEDAELELTAEAAEDAEPELTAETAEDAEPELTAETAEDAEPVLTVETAEDAEQELTDEEIEEKRKKRNKLSKKIALISGGALLAIYLGFALFFNSHFYFNTWINGRNYSLNSVEQIDTHFEKLVEEYNLKLIRSDNTVEIISGKNIELEYKKGESLTQLLKSQNPFLWPVSLFKDQNLETPVGVAYDEAKLQERIAALNLMQESSQVAPVSAHPVFKDTEFVIQEENIGSQVDAELFNEKVRASIEGFQSELDMVEDICYVLPPFLKDSPEVAAACETMNSYLGAEITYTFSSQTEVVNSEKISTWLTTDENMQVTFQKEKVAAYIAELAAKYDTYKKERTFTSGNGNTVKVTGGSYGWQIDQETEYTALCANIENKEVITKEPAYKRRAVTHDGPDWGGSYVEVDLSNQRVYLFKDGKLIDSASCVTGCVAQGHSTPQGAYSISYCQKGATLRGPKQPDGSYEWESPVRYWMPFNGGIGLHDADWRGSFGGSIYRYNGSHGCVNLPIPFAKTVFSNVSAGTPVICHY